MKEYLREDLRSLKPYRPVRGEFSLKMDANETPFPIPLEIRAQLASELLEENNYHRYPDPDADSLREKLAEDLKISRDSILIGNGSDELIRMVTNAFVDWGDAVLCPSPSFPVYSQCTRIAGGIAAEYPLGKEFCYDLGEMEQSMEEYEPKVIYIGSPNNPTGNIMPVPDIRKLARSFDGIVVVDEAYYEFCGESVISFIDQYPNLVVLRTFSHAMGIAGLRVGYLACNKNLAYGIQKIKPVFNVNCFSQRAAELIWQCREDREKQVREIRDAREWLFQALDGLRGVHPYPTKANFILFRVKNGALVYQRLLKKGILVRRFAGDPMLKDCLRVTIGRMEDNRYFLHSLAEILVDMEEW